NPKPITLTNGYYSLYEAQAKVPTYKGRMHMDYSMFDFNHGGRFLCAFPPFHAAGIGALLPMPVFRNCTVVLGPAEKPASGELCCKILRSVPCKALYSPPSVLEQLVQEPDGLELCSKLEFVVFAGGPLAPAAGDKIASVTYIGAMIGSTEIGIIPSIFPARDTWNYFEFHPIFGVDMQHVADGAYEMVLPYNPHLTWLRRFCRPNPITAEWRTKDLYKPHPTKPGLWRFYGRTDDVIVLGNGEKFNPVNMETLIQGHPLVQGALIYGQGRFQAALIVEPRTHPEDVEAFIEEMWPSIEAANVEGPGHAQIFRSKVLITTPDKPFHRVGKGTIIRKAIISDYTDELEVIYSSAIAHRGAPKLDSPQNFAAIEDFVRACALSFVSRRDITNQDDLFVNGLDSLQTLELNNGLKAGLSSLLDNADLSQALTTKTVYNNPTIEKLAHVVNRLLNPDSAGGEELSREARMEAIVRKYTEDLPMKAVNGVNSVDGTNGVASSALQIVLTGSTGTLGTNILQVLLRDPNVSKIYCLNRAPDARERHQKAFAARGEQYDLDPKVEFLTTEFGATQLGQSDEGLLTAGCTKAWTTLLANVDVIIHNAWKVNFHHQMESFEQEHIRGVHRFIDWSLSSKRHPHIFFVSSISSVAAWTARNPGQGPVPESPMSDYSIAQNFGYGESKHVSERILQIAVERSGVPASILRVGQVAGPTTQNGGVWNVHEYLPALVQTSKTIGYVPDSYHVIDWTPVDTLASIIVDIVHGGHASKESLIFNLVNPKDSEWHTFVQAVQKHFSTANLNTISLPEWIEILRKVDPNDSKQLAAMPAAKILEFYELAAQAASRTRQRYATENGVANSRTMAELAPISPELMDLWLTQWDF
ncbi:hypothetical protein LTR66_005174, partial [Elasticomyces elasticus]